MSMDPVCTSSNFNPRARVGRDRRLILPVVQGRISIHAPAWGATRHTVFARDAARNFNPRARVGRDKRDAPCTRRFPDFNPRARVGRDTPQCFLPQAGIHFNPRARVGRDQPYLQAREVLTYFNPRARVGRDGSRTPSSRTSLISIHAPAWGATELPDCQQNHALISIHAPAWGAT